MHGLRKMLNQTALQPESAEIILNTSVGGLESETVNELSILAQEAYFPYNPLYIPKDWNIHNFETSKLGSFAGGFLRKIVNEKTVAWAIVFRGTVPSNAINLVEDLLLSFEQIPSVIRVAEEYVTRQIKYLKRNPDQELVESFYDLPLYIVGHSLGATVASSIYTFISIGNDKEGRIQCVTFDNPGSLQIVKKYLENDLNRDDFSQEIMDGLAPYKHKTFENFTEKFFSDLRTMYASE